MPESSPLVTAWRLVIVLAGLLAEVWNIVNMVGQGERASEHFAYFTVQANLLVLICFGWMLLRPATHRPAWFDQFRGAVTAYIILAGLVWALLLASPSDVWTTEPAYTNFAQHRLIPWMVAIDWLVVATRSRIRLGLAWLWMLYPIGYLGSAWIRGGLIDGWYPYPFLDPNAHGGWQGLVIPTGQVLVAFLIGIALVAVTGWLRKGRAGNPRRRGSLG